MGGDSVDKDRRLATMMAAAQDGDRAAYATLLRDILGLVRAVVRGQGVAPDRIDDVVQEVLLTVHRARHTYDPARPFTPWLRVIAQRRAVDTLRSQGRQRQREVHDPIAYEGHADPAPPALQALERSGQAGRVRQAITALPPRQREAMEHLALHGRTLDQAAAKTGRSKIALKVNFHRALAALKAKFSREGGDE